MPFNEHLADRIRQRLEESKAPYHEKKMFGGLCFMVNDKMCLGIVKDQLMARIGAEAYDGALKREGCNIMNFTGREMKGYVFVDAEGYDLDRQLDHWVELSLAFNPLAKGQQEKTRQIAIRLSIALGCSCADN